MSEAHKPYTTVVIRGREIKVLAHIPLPTIGTKTYLAILANAEAMRIRDLGRK